MEPLIFGLIIMAIGAFFKNKGGDEGDEKPRRPTKGNSDQKRFKRVEDYAKEIYGEFQAQMNGQTDRKDQVNRKIEEVVEKKPLSQPARQTAKQAAKEAVKKTDDLTTGRLSAHQHRSAVRKPEPAESEELLPLSNEDVQRGIILAEILMPPKSKRR
ncbi:hypothetical protein [Planococcus salinus]|uniref:Uncharacterized protein n=1 Tax=Planococcus salinus TaxID=1848460 RepID=A0A3M8PBB3_9BACL|nr:hypothetical protein [Planococcus salinus]RNF41016.1 hypothetical protein EEX84_01295 [Planococcus salinus]